MTLLIMAIQIYHTRAAPRYATRFLALSLGMAFAGKVTECLPRSSSTPPTALARLGPSNGGSRRSPPTGLQGALEETAPASVPPWRLGSVSGVDSSQDATVPYSSSLQGSWAT